ncbi:MAG: hypothetical protein ABIJ82_00205 [Patescibacteria group bacterium]
MHKWLIAIALALMFLANPAFAWFFGKDKVIIKPYGDRDVLAVGYGIVEYVKDGKTAIYHGYVFIQKERSEGAKKDNYFLIKSVKDGQFYQVALSEVKSMTTKLVDFWHTHAGQSETRVHNYWGIKTHTTIKLRNGEELEGRIEGFSLGLKTKLGLLELQVMGSLNRNVGPQKLSEDTIRDFAYRGILYISSMVLE